MERILFVRDKVGSKQHPVQGTTGINRYGQHIPIQLPKLYQITPIYREVFGHREAMRLTLPYFQILSDEVSITVPL